MSYNSFALFLRLEVSPNAQLEKISFSIATPVIFNKSIYIRLIARYRIELLKILLRQAFLLYKSGRHLNEQIRLPCVDMQHDLRRRVGVILKLLVAIDSLFLHGKVIQYTRMICWILYFKNLFHAS